VPDIYSFWDGKDGAAQQLNGYSGGLSKTFKKYKAALKWWKANLEASTFESDSSSDSGSSSESSDSSSSSRKHRRKHRRTPHQSKDGVTPYQQAKWTRRRAR
jgi:viroplasmin and RNaseH domain-containing protein